MPPHRLHDLRRLEPFFIHFGTHRIQKLELLQACLQDKKDRGFRAADFLHGVQKGVEITAEDGIDGVVNRDGAGVADYFGNVMFFDRIEPRQ